MSMNVEEARKSFAMFDKDGSGTVTVEEFQTIYKDLGINMSEADLKSLISEMDKDGDGRLNFEEFFKWVNPDGSLNEDAKTKAE